MRRPRRHYNQTLNDLRALAILIGFRAICAVIYPIQDLRALRRMCHR